MKDFPIDQELHGPVIAHSANEDTVVQALEDGITVTLPAGNTTFYKLEALGTGEVSLAEVNGDGTNIRIIEVDKNHSIAKKSLEMLSEIARIASSPEFQNAPYVMASDYVRQIDIVIDNIERNAAGQPTNLIAELNADLKVDRASEVFLKPIEPMATGKGWLLDTNKNGVQDVGEAQVTCNGPTMLFSIGGKEAAAVSLEGLSPRDKATIEKLRNGKPLSPEELDDLDVSANNYVSNVNKLLGTPDRSRD